MPGNQEQLQMLLKVIQEQDARIKKLEKNSVGFHQHTGIDTPRIEGKDINGFPLFRTVPTYSAKNGTIVLYDGGTGTTPCIYIRTGNRGTLAWTKVGGDVGFTSRMRAYLGGDQSCTPGGARKIQFATENFDDSSEYDAATNYRFTATAAGYYYATVAASLTPDTNPDTTSFFTHIKVNNSSTAFSWVNISGTGQLNTQVSDVLKLAAGDYVEGFIDTGGANNYTLKAGSAYTFMAIHRIS